MSTEQLAQALRSLLGRIRPNSEAAPWVIAELQGIAGLAQHEAQHADHIADARKLVQEEQQAQAAEPLAWQVWWGLGEMRPHGPPFKTRNDAETHASMIKSNTEVRPLYASPPVREPLTDEELNALKPMPLREIELERLYANIPPKAQQDARSREAFKQLEASHNITGAKP